MTSRLSTALALTLLAFVSTGCIYNRSQTDTPRTATEQLLLTESIRRSIADVELPDVSGQVVAVETTSLAQDAENAWLAASLEERIRAQGATVVAADANPDMVVKAMIGAAGTSNRRYALGLEGNSGINAFPGIFIFDFHRQRGHSHVTLATRAPDGTFIAQSAPAYGTSYFNAYRVLLLFVMRSNDIYPGEEGWSFGW